MNVGELVNQLERFDRNADVIILMNGVELTSSSSNIYEDRDTQDIIFEINEE